MLYNGPEADHSLSYPGRKTYSDKGGKAIKGNLIYFITNANAKVERQFDFFVADMSGLTQAGMARLNQSMHSFIAFLALKSMSDHQSWVHQEARRKLNASFSYWSRMQSESQTF